MNTLNRLHALLDEFEFEDRESIRNYFIGALSCWVSESDWDRCLQSARTCAEERHGKRAGAPPALAAMSIDDARAMGGYDPSDRDGSGSWSGSPARFS